MEKKTVTIHWGSESTRNENEPCSYEFDTEAELNAFLLGVDESTGYMDYEILGEE